MLPNLQIAELQSSAPDFEERFSRLLDRISEFDESVESTVRKIIQRVKMEGDNALVALTNELDKNDAASVSELEISSGRLEQAARTLDSEVMKAIQSAAERVQSFHEHQVIQSWEITENDGSAYGQKVTPIERVGIYVPGGLAAYPSSVLMAAIPARVAGVSEIVMVVPAPHGMCNESVLAAAFVAGVNRVFTIGGAQAIAALAYGTRTVPKVDKIVGPGNAYVAAAKRQVFGHVGIDMVAGPSEVVVVCDESTNADWAALDMFAQSEHDTDAQSILLSTSRKKIMEVRAAMERMLPELERRDTIAKALAGQGALIHAENHEVLLELVNRIAPEHLEFLIDNHSEWMSGIRNAGAIFCGAHSAEVLGDYCAGPNHVLPTSGAARFSSALGVYDFQKRISVISCTPGAADKLARVASVMAREENLTAHARSAECRIRS